MKWKMIMPERNWSIADRFVYVMNEVRKIDEDVNNDNPHRYPLRKMKQTADKILFDALTAANEVAETARVLKEQIFNLDARNRP